jgi:hypothetical protein
MGRLVSVRAGVEVCEAAVNALRRALAAMEAKHSIGQREVQSIGTLHQEAFHPWMAQEWHRRG